MNDVIGLNRILVQYMHRPTVLYKLYEEQKKKKIFLLFRICIQVATLFLKVSNSTLAVKWHRRALGK